MADYNAFIAKSSSSTDLFLKWAPGYYQTHPQDHKIKVKLPLTVLSKNTFLELLDQIEKCKNSKVLIVSHASTDGLYLSIHSSNAKWCVMTSILLYAKLEKQYSDLVDETDPEKFTSIINEATKNLRVQNANVALKTLLDKSPSAAKKQYDKIVKQYKRISNPVQKEDMAKKMVQRARLEVKKRLNELIGAASLSKANMEAYVKLVRKIYVFDRTIEVRGCNIGKIPDVLKIMCLFLNANSVTAPRVVILFGKPDIHIERDQQRLNALMRSRATYVLGRRARCGRRGCSWMGGRSTKLGRHKLRQAYYFHPQNIASDKDELLYLRRKEVSRIVAEDISIVQKFAIEKFGKLACGKQFTSNARYLFVQATDTYPMHYPQDAAFGRHLVKVNNPGKFTL